MTMYFSSLNNDIIELLIVVHGISLRTIRQVNKSLSALEKKRLAATRIQFKFRNYRFPKNCTTGARVFVYGKFVKYYGVLLKQLGTGTFAVTNITVPGWIDIIHDPLVVKNTYKIKWVEPWKDASCVHAQIENFKQVEHRFSHI